LPVGLVDLAFLSLRFRISHEKPQLEILTNCFIDEGKNHIAEKILKTLC